MIQFFKVWFQKLFDREAIWPAALLVCGTIMRFLDMSTHDQWWISSAAFCGLLTAGVVAKKIVDGRNGGPPA